SNERQEFATVYVHGACCETVRVWPAMVTVPTRSAPPFGSTATMTVPLPVPPAPSTTWRKPSFETAVHVQSWRDSVTTMVKLPPPTGAAMVAGDRVAVQPTMGMVTVLEVFLPHT